MAVIQNSISMYTLVYMDSRKWIIDFVPTNLASNNPVPMSVDQFTLHYEMIAVKTSHLAASHMSNRMSSVV